ncbi:glutathione S-transferase [Pseudomonas sp. MSSRFD41]|uniref:glutathione S-transferase family protein n=1 Tax=unclassified Pseudomonas TaxID=196821 RepID=UPI00163B3445|nr:glutathione S-transferase [Pseudomonas sp. MSSRFD41]MBC2658848.1 glutathione S-transferase [Pseudomonas sp. MSSRFD41]
MYHLYGSQGTGSAMVEIALEYCQAPYRCIEAAPWQASPGRDALERLNPLLQIPTLQLPDGSILTESAAILIHLGLQFADSGLLPTQAAARAQVIRGLVYIAANCYSAIGILDYPARWVSDADPALEARVRQATGQRLHHAWELFARQFAPRPFLSGDAPGALDIQAAVVSRWGGARDALRHSQPHFVALLERIEHEPRVAPVLARHWPESR